MVWFLCGVGVTLLGIYILQTHRRTWAAIFKGFANGRQLTLHDDDLPRLQQSLQQECIRAIGNRIAGNSIFALLHEGRAVAVTLRLAELADGVHLTTTEAAVKRAYRMLTPTLREDEARIRRSLCALNGMLESPANKALIEAMAMQGVVDARL